MTADGLIPEPLGSGAADLTQSYSYNSGNLCPNCGSSYTCVLSPKYNSMCCWYCISCNELWEYRTDPDYKDERAFSGASPALTQGWGFLAKCIAVETDTCIWCDRKDIKGEDFKSKREEDTYFDLGCCPYCQRKYWGERR